MAGYTDAAFRAVCAQQGARLCFTEMASADALSRNNGTTLRLLERSPEESLTGFQIFGSSPAVAAAAVRRIAPLRPGHRGPELRLLGAEGPEGRVRRPAPSRPGPHRVNRGGHEVGDGRPRVGEAPPGVGRVQPHLPRLRGGGVKAGASLVTLHPRTSAQGFSGTAQWNHIRILKEACPVPVIGSGDLFTAQDCLRMITTTGCDGVMIARGCLGNPFIFAQAEALLKGQAAQLRIEADERLSTAIAHLKLLAESVGEDKACRDMRKHFVAYTKGLAGGSMVRQSVVYAERIDEYEEIVESYLRE